MSTSRTLAMTANIPADGWDLFEHHREIVVSFFLIASANHRFVLCFSASMTFNLFNGICGSV